MCGITGLIYSDFNRIVEPTKLAKMTDTLYHRGPDDTGLFFERNVGLGFRRLSIIDLHGGHQPMSDPDGRYTIVFNGEIYNYQQNRNMLKAYSYSFRTNSDTEVLLYLYIQYKEKCLEFLRGMFSFAIFDNYEKTVFCARDRFGIKPFYYYHDENVFIFGSELKSLLKSELIEKSLSEIALDSYFAYGYVSRGSSIFKNVNKLPHSNYMLLNIKDWSINFFKYWEPSYHPILSYDESEWISLIQAKLRESVSLHMVSDVPIGSFLSGGIDSSAITAYMAMNSASAIQTFSIGFNDNSFNELPIAREVAQKYNTIHHTKIVTPDSISIIPKIIAGFDEPFADSSAIPTYYVSKFAKEHVTVVLSGDGGDELFAGYNMYDKMQKLHRYNLPHHPITSSLLTRIGKILPDTGPSQRFLYFLSKNKQNIGAYSGIFTQWERQRIIPGIVDGIGNNYVEFYAEDIISNTKSSDFLTRMQNLNLNVVMVDDILAKVDRMSMMNSLEVRVPMLDHEFAELIFKIPQNLKYRKGKKKYILRQALNNILPPSVLSHSKRGFSIPLAQWLRSELKDYTHDLLLNSANSKIDNFVDKREMTKVLEAHLQKRADFSAHLWVLIVLENWLQENN